MHYNVIVYVLVIDFLAILSPGPDFFMVLKNSLTNSLRAGFFTTLGISIGSTIMFFLGIFGIGIIVASSKFLFTLVKVSGAVYLCYLALKSLFAKVYIKEPQLVYSNINTFKLKDKEFFKIGLICNLTNPKAFMFIVSLSTYVNQHGNAFKDGIVIILVSFIATASWFILVSYIFGNIRVRRFFYKRQRIINIIFGILLLYVAFGIIFL